VALAACGTGTAPSGSAATGASNTSAQLAFAECMRSHGVSGFPDPGGATPSGPSIKILGIALPSTIDVRSPAFQSAMNACQKLITGGAPKPGVSAARAGPRVLAMHAYAGVSNFPDPVFRDGRIGLRIGQETTQ
jgi:hypothetical protein